MILKGQDVHDGLREWIKTDIREISAKGYDLGKFLFSVSVGTLGALTALIKIDSSTQINTPFIVSASILFISIVIAISIVLPKSIPVGDNIDLLDLYRKQLQAIIRVIWAWFFVWLIGAITGGFAVFTP
jgi:hypothetical protein